MDDNDLKFCESIVLYFIGAALAGVKKSWINGDHLAFISELESLKQSIDGSISNLKTLLAERESKNDNQK